MVDLPAEFGLKHVAMVRSCALLVSVVLRIQAHARKCSGQTDGSDSAFT